MTSFRRVALSLGLVAACGGALVFSLSKASGAPKQDGAPKAVGVHKVPGAPAKVKAPAARVKTIAAPAPAIKTSAPVTSPTPASTANPTLKQTIGISPVQPEVKHVFVFGGTGNDSYDLQNEVVYSLLRQSGVPIPNVLHPLSTAKPSFILEHLIVYSLTGGSSSASGGAQAPNANTPQNTAPGARGGTAANAPAAPKPYTDVERTIMQVGAVVDAEISRGSGRLGGAHLQKLRLLSAAITALESANRLGAGAGATPAAGGRPGAPGGGGTTSKLDPRELLFGQARVDARAADRFTPTGL